MKDQEIDLDIIAIPSEDAIIIEPMNDAGRSFFIDNLRIIKDKKVIGDDVQRILKLIREKKLKHNFRTK